MAIATLNGKPITPILCNHKSEVNVSGCSCPAVHAEMAVVNYIIKHYKWVCLNEDPYTNKKYKNVNKKKFKKSKKKLSKVCVYVTRLSRSNDELVKSDPCLMCSNVLKSMGIGKVVFTCDNEGGISSKKVSRYHTEHISARYRSIMRGEIKDGF